MVELLGSVNDSEDVLRRLEARGARRLAGYAAVPMAPAAPGEPSTTVVTVQIADSLALSELESIDGVVAVYGDPQIAPT
jgi:hypothetical protein